MAGPTQRRQRQEGQLRRGIAAAAALPQTRQQDRGGAAGARRAGKRMAGLAAFLLLLLPVSGRRARPLLPVLRGDGAPHPPSRPGRARPAAAELSLPRCNGGGGSGDAHHPQSQPPSSFAEGSFKWGERSARAQRRASQLSAFGHTKGCQGEAFPGVP